MQCAMGSNALHGSFEANDDNNNALRSNAVEGKETDEDLLSTRDSSKNRRTENDKISENNENEKNANAKENSTASRIFFGMGPKRPADCHWLHYKRSTVHVSRSRSMEITALNTFLPVHSGLLSFRVLPFEHDECRYQPMNENVQLVSSFSLSHTHSCWFPLCCRSVGWTVSLMISSILPSVIISIRFFYYRYFQSEINATTERKSTSFELKLENFVFILETLRYDPFHECCNT